MRLIVTLSLLLLGMLGLTAQHTLNGRLVDVDVSEYGVPDAIIELIQGGGTTGEHGIRQ